MLAVETPRIHVELGDIAHRAAERENEGSGLGQLVAVAVHSAADAEVQAVGERVHRGVSRQRQVPDAGPGAVQ